MKCRINIIDVLGDVASNRNSLLYSCHHKLTSISQCIILTNGSTCAIRWEAYSCRQEGAKFLDLKHFQMGLNHLVL